MLTYVTSGRFTITKSRVKCQVWHFSMTFSFPLFQSSSLGPRHPRGASGHWPCPLPYSSPCSTLSQATTGFHQSWTAEFRNFHEITELRYIFDLYLYTSPQKEKHLLEKYKILGTTIKWRFQRLRSWNGNNPHLLKPENHRGWGFATMTIGRDDQMPETLQGHRGWTPNWMDEGEGWIF